MFKYANGECKYIRVFVGLNFPSSFHGYNTVLFIHEKQNLKITVIIKFNLSVEKKKKKVRVTLA